MSVDLERNAIAAVVAVRDGDRARLEHIFRQCDHLPLVEEMAEWLMNFMAVAKLNAMKAQLGFPVEPDVFTRAENVDAFLDLWCSLWRGEGRSRPQ